MDDHPSAPDDSDASHRGGRHAKKRGPGRRRRHLPLWQELPLLLIIAFGLAVLIRTFLVQMFFIPTGSMEDTLKPRDRVLVNKVTYDFRGPIRGEVVVFRGSEKWAPEVPTSADQGIAAKTLGKIGDLVGFGQTGEKDFIKRIIGLPGDTVACCDVNGKVTINGKPLDEPFVTKNSPNARGDPQHCTLRQFPPATIGEGQVFVLGDHRDVSQDSRCHGTAPIKNILGRAFVVAWPPSRWHSLPIPETFGKLPQPQGMVAPSVSVAPVGGAGVLPMLLSLGVALPRWPSRSRRVGVNRAYRRSRRARTS